MKSADEKPEPTELPCREAVFAADGELPYLRIRLGAADLDALLAELDECTRAAGRKWFKLRVCAGNPPGLRLRESKKTPKYEARAAGVYLRGRIVRVSGRTKGCDIAFSGRLGAASLAACLRSARSKMSAYLELRIPDRKRELLEFVPDSELAAALPSEQPLVVQLPTPASTPN